MGLRSFCTVDGNRKYWLTKLGCVIYTVVTASLFYHKWFALVIGRRENEMNENDKQIRKLTKRSVIIAVLALALVLALVIGFVRLILPVFEKQPAREPKCYIGSLCLPEQAENLTTERKTKLDFSDSDENGDRQANIYDSYSLRYDGDEPMSITFAYPVLDLTDIKALEIKVNGAAVNAEYCTACSAEQFAEDRQKDIVKEKLERGEYFKSAFPAWPQLDSSDAAESAVAYCTFEISLEQYEYVNVEISFMRSAGSGVSFVSDYGDIMCAKHDFSIVNTDLM